MDSAGTAKNQQDKEQQTEDVKMSVNSVKTSMTQLPNYHYFILQDQYTGIYITYSVKNESNEQ